VQSIKRASFYYKGFLLHVEHHDLGRPPYYGQYLVIMYINDAVIYVLFVVAPLNNTETDLAAEFLWILCKLLQLSW
jgi:hypothetical protein